MINISITVYTYNDDEFDPIDLYVTYFRHDVDYGKEHFRIRKRYENLFKKRIKSWNRVNNEVIIYELPSAMHLSVLIYDSRVEQHYVKQPHNPMVWIL